MSKVKEHIYTLGAITMIAALLIMVAISGPSASNAAPLGAPTPVTYVQGVNAPRDMVFFSGTPIAVTTPQRVCYQAPEYGKLDLQYSSGGVNTVTLALEASNDNVTWVTNQTVINASSTPVAATMQQYNMYGKYTCATVTLANATPVAVVVKGLAK